jgi:tetratricopeptide (TPR) repeat protein
MDILSSELRTNLKRVGRACCKQAELFKSFGEVDVAFIYLTRSTQCQYLLTALENPCESSRNIVRMSVKKVLEESRYWQRNLGKVIVHSLGSENADKGIKDMLTGKDRLFWEAYNYAEHWQNSRALDLFAKIVQQDRSALNLHWYGNLLAKQFRFLEAREPLEIAARLEPERYNHHSHLGNVYRALGMNKEAEISYRWALDLIFNKPELGRVEYIHLVRCYQGLAELKVEDCAELEGDVTKLALDSEEVTSKELERIKF